MQFKMYTYQFIHLQMHKSEYSKFTTDTTDIWFYCMFIPASTPLLPSEIGDKHAKVHFMEMQRLQILPQIPDSILLVTTQGEIWDQHDGIFQLVEWRRSRDGGIW